jgi:hypothetical protein
MRLRYSFAILLAVAVSACSDSVATAPLPPDPIPPVAPVLLRDIAYSSLPSPFYHFEYDARGRISMATYASGLRSYGVTYEGDRLSQMVSNVGSVREKLGYLYDDAGRVGMVVFVDANGLVYMHLIASYDGSKLVGLEWSRRVDAGFIVEKTMSFSYHPDGNLRELTVHRPPIEGRQLETTLVDRFDGYDDGINVDGFGLIHDEFFEHVVLLPGVQLQKSNPARVTHTGDGINFDADYAYTYDATHRPLVRRGDVTLTNGDSQGQRFQTTAEYSYY